MSMTIDDAATIRAFRQGDEAAFDTVVAEHRQELLRHARRRCPDDATAEDLVQEAFVRAYRAFGRLPDDGRLRPWLHQILHNVCIDDSHRRHREIDKVDRVIAEASARCFDLGPEETLGLDIDYLALEQAMSHIPATHRDAFVQRVVDGLEYDEIAIRGGVSELNARARVSRARIALRRALQGAAVIPLTLYLVVRRPGRNALAVGPSDPSAATVAPSTATAASTANRLATTFAPALDAASATASGAVHTVPILTKAAVGIGAVATMTFAAGPEPPVERATPVTVEVAATTTAPAPAPLNISAPPAPVPPPVADAASAGDLAGTTAIEETVPTTAAAATTIPAALGAVAPSADTSAVTTVLVTTVPATTIAPTTTVLVTTVPATTIAPTTTVPVTTVPATTIAPTTTAPPETTVATTLPPLTGGSLQASVSVTPAGPRLDLAGSVTLSTGDSQAAGSISGRLGVGEPDPAGSRRLDGTFIISVDGGTIELRLAGYGTSTESVEPGVTPTSLTMSGVYRATGATGQLATSGSFSGSLAGSTLVLTLSI